MLQSLITKINYCIEHNFLSLQKMNECNNFQCLGSRCKLASWLDNSSTVNMFSKGSLLGIEPRICYGMQYLTRLDLRTYPLSSNGNTCCFMKSAQELLSRSNRFDWCCWASSAQRIIYAIAAFRLELDRNKEDVERRRYQHYVIWWNLDPILTQYERWETMQMKWK